MAWHCATASGAMRRRLPEAVRARPPLLLLLGGGGVALDLDGRGGHAVLDRHLGADLEVADDLGVGGAGDLPLLLPLLHHDGVGADLEDGAGDLLGVDLGGEGGAAAESQHQSEGSQSSAVHQHGHGPPGKALAYRQATPIATLRYPRPMAGIGFDVTEEQQQLIDTAREFTRKEITPVAGAYDEEGKFPKEIIERAWQTGLVNCEVPEAYGGLGLGNLSHCLRLEELSYGCLGINTRI